MSNKKEFKDIKIEIFEIVQDVILYSGEVNNKVDGLEEDDNFFYSEN